MPDDIDQTLKHNLCALGQIYDWCPFCDAYEDDVIVLG